MQLTYFDRRGGDARCPFAVELTRGHIPIIVILAHPRPEGVYGIAFVCSSVVLWGGVFVLMLAGWCFAFFRRSMGAYWLANAGSFSFYCLPIILLFTGVIKYCGE